jgi:hypothetical protein
MTSTILEISRKFKVAAEHYKKFEPALLSVLPEFNLICSSTQL